MTGNVIDVKNLSIDAIAKRGERTPIVQNVSFSVAPGRVVALIGESGSGKTTISLACLGYTRPGCAFKGGEILLDGTDVLQLDLAGRRQVRGVDISYVAQSAAASFNSALSINRQVTEVPQIRNLMSQDDATRKAAALYGELDLPSPETIGRRYPHQVSGGQLQRLMAAMAMMCSPKLLILDEPTTALDVTTQIDVLQAFKNLVRENRTSAIYVSHDLAVVAQIADEILVLRDGRMVEYGPTQTIITVPRQDYTRQLIAAAHVMPAEVTQRTSRGDGAHLLSVKGVSAGYGRQREVPALRDVSLDVRAAETVGVIGESGSGKSTLGRVISGLMAPWKGGVLLRGRPLAASLKQRTRDELREVQIVFQMADVALNPRHAVSKILGRPLAFYLGADRRAIESRVGELLELVGLDPAMARRFPRELSGGQKQRVNLARALAADPRLIICDEITSALDTVVAEAILDLLVSLQDRLNVAYIFISHDISTIARIADRVAVMRDGEIVETGPTAEVLRPPHHDYTDLLLRSVPDLRVGWLETVMEHRRRTGQHAAGN